MVHMDKPKHDDDSVKGAKAGRSLRMKGRWKTVEMVEMVKERAVMRA